MDECQSGPYRYYFLEGSGTTFAHELAALLTALEERGEIVEHLATHAVLGTDGMWRQAAQVVGRIVAEPPGPHRRPPAMS